MINRPREIAIDTEWSPPPRRLELPVGEVHAWLAPLTSDRPLAGVGDPASELSDDEKQQASRFRFDRDRDRYLRSHTLLRRLLGRYLDEAPAAVRIVRSPNGKPMLPDDSPLTFNMSHSSTLGLFGFTRTGPIGVDVERLRASVDVVSLSERFFTEAESRLIADANGDDRLRYFFTAWVRKEAVVKAVGRGLAIPLSAVDVTPGDPAPHRTASLAEDPPSTWQIIDLPAPADHRAALATADRPTRIHCFEVPSSGAIPRFR